MKGGTTMKKTYMSPLVKQEYAQASHMQASSGINSNNGIGYGGIDNDGSKEPSVKEFLWDDADE